MRYLFFLLIVASSCKQAAKKDAISGKWEYIRMEMYSGEPMNLVDPAISKLHQSQKGLTFSFTKGNIFKVTQRSADGDEKFVAEQPYELAADQKNLRLKNSSGRADDNFPIVELSDSLLKINIFYSDKAYMVFGKKD